MLVLVLIYELLAFPLLFDYFGIDVGSGGFIIPNPNTLGFVLMGLSILVSLAIHYLIALAVAKWIEKRRRQ